MNFLEDISDIIGKHLILRFDPLKKKLFILSLKSLEKYELPKACRHVIFDLNFKVMIIATYRKRRKINKVKCKSNISKYFSGEIEHSSGYFRLILRDSQFVEYLPCSLI